MKNKKKGIVITVIILITVSIAVILFPTLLHHNAHETPNTENSISSDDATKIWEDFLLTGNYSNFTENWEKTSLEYIITDINADTIPELLIQSSADSPFYNTWLFTLNNKEIVLVNETYGYGSFRYSPGNNAVIESPEWKPFSGTEYSPFYSLHDTQLEYMFEIGQDEGKSYYSDSTGTKNINDDERAAYYIDTIDFEWNPIQSLTTISGMIIPISFPNFPV